MHDSGRELTVGMPVRNGERFLEGALHSILEQDVDLELLIGDNASDDRTEEICRDLASADDRIRYHRHDVNVGANRNFNWLAQHSRSPFFRWAAVDDLLDGPVLSHSITALRHEPGASLAFTSTVLIDDLGRPVRQRVDDEGRASAADPVERFVDVLRHEVWCFPIFGVMRGELLARTGLLRPFYGADRVLLAELALLGPFLRIDGPRFLRRCHDDQSAAMSVQEKARWTVGGGRMALPAPIAATAAFLGVAARGPVPISRRAAAVGAVAGHVARRLERVVRPGPFNYLGVRGREAVDPSAHLDLRVDADDAEVELPRPTTS